MSVEKVIPVVRDMVFLSAGTYVFVQEAVSEARWEPMLLGIVMAAGPAALSALWPARTTAPPLSPPSPSSSSSSSPSPPSSSGEL